MKSFQIEEECLRERKTFSTLNRFFRAAESSRTRVLAVFEWIAVLRLDGRSDAPAQSNRIDRSALAEAFQHGHLRGEHVSFMNRG